jgi:glycosyltransferase involved in cell wall biosynthesis
MPYQPKVALVHDDFTQSGGAESLFATIAAMYPNAPIYTSLVNWRKLPSSIEKNRINTSFMQKIPFASSFFKLLLPFYPLAFESFDFDKYDVVISSTTRFAKAIITKPKTIHIAYVNSTPRFLWSEDTKKEYLNPVLAFFAKPYLGWLKRWDKAASARVDFYISNSKNIQGKIKDVYGRESEVICPYANADFFTPAKIHNWKLKSQNYYLIVSRLVKWKKIDLAIEAVKEIGVNLIIIGDGPDRGRLEGIAQSKTDKQESDQSQTKSRVTFVGKVTRDQLREYYQNSKALIVTQEEDFGIAAVEAQACGRPVVAYEKGGAAEVVVSGKTGVFFKKQTKESLKDAIAALGRVKWEDAVQRASSLRFSKAVFVKSITKSVEKYARGRR